MTITEIIYSVIVPVLIIIGYFLVHYLIIRFNLQKAINENINNAEELEKAGSEKMIACVDSLYDLIPVWLKIFFNKTTIEKWVQHSFDKMCEWAKKQNEKKSN